MTHRPLISLIAFAAVLTAAEASAQSIGKAVKADRTVTGSQSGTLNANSPVFANERIRANSTGLGHFQFNDGTKMVVGPGTNLVLDQTIYNPNGSKFTKFAISSSAGALRFISGSSPKGTYEIKTPTGTLGIRGTSFDMRHFRGRTYIMLVSGEVNFCSNSGSCQTIQGRCNYVVAHPGGKVTPPVLPRNGIYGSGDMQEYFPFINNQAAIAPDFQLSVNQCSGGSGWANGDQPGIGDPGDPGFGSGGNSRG